jgi:hypothetical protein
LYKTAADQSVAPEKLQQHYLVTALPEKLDHLFSFVKANTGS